MAIPSVVRLLPGGQPVGTPTEGPTAGKSLVAIYGDGFRLPPAPAPGGPSGPVQGGIVSAETPRTVSVTFGGAEAVRVDVIRSNLLHVVTPISPLEAVSPGYGAGSVDVVITNLDDSGDPIPGESVTVPGGWTYRRPQLDATTESDLVRFVRTFIRHWKRQVLPEVVFTTHTDYDTDIATAQVEIASMPAIVLTLQSLPENRFYSINRGPVRQLSADHIEEYRRPHTVDLNFQIVGISDNIMEAMNLLAVAVDFVDRNHVLEFARDPNDANAGSVEYEFDFGPGGEFEMNTRPSKSNIHSFSGSVVVRGFSFEGLQGFAGDGLTRLSRELTDPVNLDAGPIAG